MENTTTDPRLSFERAPPNRRFPWNAQTRARLRELFVDEGKSQSQCAEKLMEEFGGHLTNSAIASQVAALRRRGVIPAGAARRSTQGRSRSFKGLRKPRAPRPAPPPPPPASQHPATLAVAEPLIGEDGMARSIDTIGPGECRWIYGDPKSEHAYCGRPMKDRTRSFCEGHLLIAYPPERQQQAKQRREEEKQKRRANAA